MPRQARPVALARQLGARLRVLRERAELTQEGLAWACDISKGFLSELESGKRFPSMPTLHRLVRRLGVDLVDVFAVDPRDPRTALLDALRVGDGDRAAEVLATITASKARKDPTPPASR